ncbi:MAG: L-serine dehydratase [Thermosediminibacterales bacterium]|nr:L-serine dehydratase [Thermosediminibacterales bacterium]
MKVLDVIGPIMIGPSSSHTAGAVRLGRIARNILGEEPVSAKLTLHGSFSKTYRGHGTDLALVAGLLGMNTDDERIPSAIKIAERKGLKVSFSEADLGDVHPNTVRFELKSAGDKKAVVVGSSTGGGSIEIVKINGFETSFKGEFHTLITQHEDKPGVISEVTTVLAQYGINIAFMRVSRKEKGNLALMIIETDNPIPNGVRDKIAENRKIYSAIAIEPI